MVTDLLVTAVCLYSYYQLTKRKLPGQAQLFFRYYFLLIGISTFFGGVIGHGFLYALRFEWKLPGWIISMISVALIERSSISHARPFIIPSIGIIFLAINILELLCAISITLYTLDFFWVEAHAAYGLLVVVASFHGYVYLKSRDKGSLLILSGVAITACASIIFMNEISIHKWFNHIDISHVLLSVASYIFYKGALHLQQPEKGNK